MAQSIFFTAVSDSVKKVIEARKSAYGNTGIRESDHLNWLTKKAAYANAIAISKGKQITLNPSPNGGLGPNGLYQGGRYSINGRWAIKPHLSSVKITTDGELGSLKKCNITFVIYTLADLDAYQPFFDIGAELIVNYGWTGVSDSLAGAPGRFTGIITNFSYSVNPDGSFNCSCDGTGAGIAALAANINAPGSPASTATDSLEKEFIPNSLSTYLIGMKQQFHSENPDAAGDTVYTINYNGTSITMGYAKKDEIGIPEDDEKTENKDNGAYYITMIDLVKVVNSILQFNSAKFNSVFILCDENRTITAVPKDTADLVSADVTKVIFPGFGLYYDPTAEEASQNQKPFRVSFDSWAGAKAFKDKGSIGMTMLNIDWLLGMLRTQGSTPGDNQPSADLTFAKFFVNIFQGINDYSGTRFKLSLVQDPADSTGKRYIISDVNVADEGVTPTTLTAITKDSICRTISLQAKVPSGFATSAYVGAANAVGAGTYQTPDGNSSTSSNPYTKLYNAKKNYANSPSQENSDALKSALKEVYAWAPGGDANLKALLIFPLEFSVSLDGIAGFNFGNVIDTNYLPSIYRTNGTKTAFTITKIEHSIQDNDWVTTLSTVMRIVPGKANTTGGGSSTSLKEQSQEEVKKQREESDKKAQEQKSALKTNVTNAPYAMPTAQSVSDNLVSGAAVKYAQLNKPISLKPK